VSHSTVTECLRAALSAAALATAMQAAAAPAAPQSTASETRVNRAISRCTELGELLSCYAALGVRPNDPGLLIAEADGLVQMKRPGEAIGVYRNALRSGALRDVVEPKIAVAQARRLSLLAVCETDSGEVAERACESAWLPGAPDEVTVFKRRGALLQDDKQFSAALDAYLAAARLAPHDRGVARAIVTLSEGSQHSDTSVLTARGSALMTLGLAAEAVVPLRQALRQSPDLAEAKAGLRAAQRALASQGQGSLSNTDPGPPAAGVMVPGHAFSNESPVTRSN